MRDGINENSICDKASRCLGVLTLLTFSNRHLPGFHSISNCHHHLGVRVEVLHRRKGSVKDGNEGLQAAILGPQAAAENSLALLPRVSCGAKKRAFDCSFKETRPDCSASLFPSLFFRLESRFSLEFFCFLASPLHLPQSQVAH